MISGKYLACVFETHVIEGAQKWTARESHDKLDGQTGAHQGFSANEHGSGVLEVTMELVQDLLTGEYLSVQSGQTINNLRLYRKDTDNVPAFAVPVFKVFESETMGEVKGRFTVRVSGESYGPYTANNPGAG